MKIYFKDGKQFIFRFNFHITFAKAINNHSRCLVNQHRFHYLFLNTLCSPPSTPLKNIPTNINVSRDYVYSDGKKSPADQQSDIWPLPGYTIHS